MSSPLLDSCDHRTSYAYDINDRFRHPCRRTSAWVAPDSGDRWTYEDRAWRNAGECCDAGLDSDEDSLIEACQTEVSYDFEDNICKETVAALKSDGSHGAFI